MWEVARACRRREGQVFTIPCGGSRLATAQLHFWYRACFPAIPLAHLLPAECSTSPSLLWPLPSPSAEGGRCLPGSWKAVADCMGAGERNVFTCWMTAAPAQLATAVHGATEQPAGARAGQPAVVRWRPAPRPTCSR